MRLFRSRGPGGISKLSLPPWNIWNNQAAWPIPSDGEEREYYATFYREHEGSLHGRINVTFKITSTRKSRTEVFSSGRLAWDLDTATETCLDLVPFKKATSQLLRFVICHVGEYSSTNIQAETRLIASLLMIFIHHPYLPAFTVSPARDSTYSTAPSAAMVPSATAVVIWR